MKTLQITVIVAFASLNLMAQNSPLTRTDTSARGSSFSLPQQQENVFSSTDLQIFPSADLSIHQSEFSIAVNRPYDWRIDLVGTNTMKLNSSGDQEYVHQGYYRSTNAGVTWAGSDHLPGTSNWTADPAVAYSGAWIEGHFCYMQYNGYPTYAWDLRVSTSIHGGVDWGTPAIIPNSGDPDKPHMIASAPSDVYVAWTDFTGLEPWCPLGGPFPVKFARSIDGGSNFQTIGAISGSTVTGENSLGQGVNLATGPSGEVYAVWAIYDNWCTNTHENAIGFNKSTNRGLTWQTATRAFDIRGTRDLWSHKNPLGEDIRVNSFPSMVVDKSGGSRNGWLYVVWTDEIEWQQNPGIFDRDIFLRRSTDGGNTWSSPLRVNNDSPPAPKDQFLPWMTVDPFGTIFVVFYDSRNDPTNMLSEVWVAESHDGGQSFTNYRVSDVAFYITPIVGWPIFYWGDYIGITSVAGKVYASWMDNRRTNPSGNNIYQAFVDIIDLIPYAPQNLQVQAYNNNPRLTWNANIEDDLAASPYKVYRKIIQIGGPVVEDWRVIATVSGTSYIDNTIGVLPKPYQYTVFYKLTATDLAGSESAYSNEVSINVHDLWWKPAHGPLATLKPTVFGLSQNVPNPFNPATVITYQVPEDIHVTLKVFDVLGQEIAQLVDEVKEAGYYLVPFDASRLSTGIYFYRMTAGEFVAVRKLVVMK